MAQVLLFNIAGDRRRKLRFLLTKLGIPCREIAPERQASSLGELCGREGFDAAEDCGAPFSGEMLVMDSLSSFQFSALLDAMRREKLTVALKAVVTDTNLGWSAQRLHSELSAEHEAMRRAAGGSVHAK